jgi:hypothetical protein
VSKETNHAEKRFDIGGFFCYTTGLIGAAGQGNEQYST